MPATPTSRSTIVRYIASRLGQSLIVLWAAYTVSFIVLYALPSDPVALLAGGDASDVTPEQLAELTAQYGLDKPLVVQYLLRLGGVLRGDFGTSIATGRPVSEVIGEAVSPTLQLVGLAFLIAVLAGAGLAVLATYVRGRALSTFLLGLPPLGVAIPSFWFGLMLIQWFSFQLPLFPAMGDKSAVSLVLPSIALALPTGAMIAQLLSKSLATALGEAYIDTARAKGADRRRVHLRHALRNAALPAITMTGLIVGQLLSGTVVTETVFSRPGVGRVTASAVQQQDIPVVQGIVLFAAAAFVLANLAVDLVYPLLDPRIQLTAAPRRRRQTPVPTHAEAPVAAEAATDFDTDAVLEAAR
ncbi:peptide/nickel transport system permease protein [Microbacterium natoriense]|uniref:Peptide/nickel transport system permease protein n=1 Tax=Microbacterium natoriense TaxID=284570 RepID=A0AAW8F0T9_9MICO|nr:ABC transporter permease [Microbacterium natoriense]MDQ0649360.1 peptide/nickel transport system permease protein [Microbacterium natoriense]